MGTIVALAPIGIGIAEQTGVAPALALSAVIGGAMFGDNLSMISDTTIAAVRTQNTQMKDKFKVNFFIVLPAAIVTA
ncbi:Na+/H+ antiporter NhaC family protein, partial [Pantoea sp. SIMBA_133]